jgi:hypothetical protein
LVSNSEEMLEQPVSFYVKVEELIEKSLAEQLSDEF